MTKIDTITTEQLRDHVIDPEVRDYIATLLAEVEQIDRIAATTLVCNYDDADNSPADHVQMMADAMEQDRVEIERLRAPPDGSWYDAEIKRLQQRLERTEDWRRKHDTFLAENQRLRTENARLREALGPFAALGKELHDGWRDSSPCFGINDATFSYGDIRKATALLKKGPDHD